MPDINNIPTTQYVGPKIIPHLWDPIQWDSTTTYDALAIVQNEGNTYVSRYIVPAGTQITNTEYWVRFATWNAQVEQYIQQVQTFDGRITDNASDIAQEITDRTTADQNQSLALGSAVSALQLEIDTKIQELSDSIGEDIQTLTENTETAISNIENEQVEYHKNLQHAKIICIGDSWNAGVADGAMTDYSVENGWGRKLCANMGIDATTELKNYGQPSAGFVAPGGANQRTFIDLLELAITSIGDDADKVSHIVVGGGVNDSSYVIAGNATVANVRTAVTAFCNAANNAFPNATVYMFPMLWAGHNAVRLQDIQVKNAIIVGARNANCPVAICEHTPEWLFGRAEYFGSGTQGHHTTLDGLAETARFMAEFINGGPAHFTYFSNLRDTSKTAALTITQVSTQIHDGVLRFRLRGAINDNFDSSTVPFFSLPSGNTFFSGYETVFVLAAISGNQAPILCTANGTDFSLSSRLASTPESGQQLYADFTIPFAF